jgi:hypothetical protein
MDDNMDVMLYEMTFGCGVFGYVGIGEGKLVLVGGLYAGASGSLSALGFAVVGEGERFRFEVISFSKVSSFLRTSPCNLTLVL